MARHGVDDEQQLFMPSGAATIYFFVVNVNKASEETRRKRRDAG